MTESSGKIKFGAIILFGMNCLLGAGIFLTPGRAYANLGMNLFWVLAVCAILAIIMALVFAEMAGKFTRTGGVYVYVKEAFGPFLGFNVGFMRFLAACVALAVQMTALPNIINTLTGIIISPFISAIISIIFIIVLCGINMISVRVASIFTSITSWIVLAILIISILSTVFFVNMSNFTVPENLVAGAGTAAEHMVPTHGLSGAAFASGFLLLFYAFVGFENIGVAAQDMENPTKNIPRAIIIVLCVVTIIYFLLFFGIIGVLGPDAVSSNNSVADGVHKVLGSSGNILISIGSIIALTGIGLAMSFAGPRNLVPLAVDNFLPQNAGANNKRGVPAQSILIMLIVTIIFIIVANIMSKDSFQLLVGVATVCRLIQYVAVAIGTFKIRKKGIPGTYKLPFAGILVTIAVLVCIYLAFQVKLQIIWLTLAVIVISLIIYYAYSLPRYKKNNKGA
jgi:amino acid transporter